MLVCYCGRKEVEKGEEEREQREEVKEGGAASMKEVKVHGTTIYKGRIYIRQGRRKETKKSMFLL